MELRGTPNNALSALTPATTPAARTHHCPPETYELLGMSAVMSPSVRVFRNEATMMSAAATRATHPATSTAGLAEFDPAAAGPGVEVLVRAALDSITDANGDADSLTKAGVCPRASGTAEIGVHTPDALIHSHAPDRTMFARGPRTSNENLPDG
jgi:hypothetical protein